MILPLVFPAVVAGSIFTFSLTLGDFITPSLVGSGEQFIGTVVTRQLHRQPAVRRRVRDGADRDHDRLPADRQAAGGVRAPMRIVGRHHSCCCGSGPGSRSRSSTCPLLVVVIYAFSTARTFEWPPPGFTLEWFEQGDRQHRRPRRALVLGEGRPAGDRRRARSSARSPRSPSPATGSSAARRSRSWSSCRSRCPGIVTGIALNSTFTQVLGIDARPAHDRDRPRDLLHRRRLQQRDRAAAADVVPRSRRRRPTSARPRGRPSAWSPCRICAAPWSPARCSPSRSPSTRSSSPRSRSAPATRPCRSGSSNNFSRPNQLPIVNVVAVFVILLSIIPVYFAHKLTQDEGGGGAPGGGAGAAVVAETAAAP